VSRSLLTPQVLVPTVSPDIYNLDMRYRSVLRRLDSKDYGILEVSAQKIKTFLDSREARGLSLPRVIKYGNCLLAFSKYCSKPFEEMTQDDVREVLVSLKNRDKIDPRFTVKRNDKSATTTNRNGWHRINDAPSANCIRLRASLQRENWDHAINLLENKHILHSTLNIPIAIRTTLENNAFAD
jgi:hypothetical protein